MEGRIIKTTNNSDEISVLSEVSSGAQQAVILLEGRRNIPQADADKLQKFGEWIAEKFPGVLFRSGNADGSDTAFARGVTATDPSRLQYVLPTDGMGRQRRHPVARCYSLTDLPQVELERLSDISAEVSPRARRLVDAACGRLNNRFLAGKGRFLLRDTLKVAGFPGIDLQPVTLGIFYVDPADPDAGGTGHTIRVCRRKGIQVVTQETFLKWPTEGW